MNQLATMHKDAGSKFFRVQLTPADEQQAANVSPLFLALLQNKIESYASALVDTVPAYDPDPRKQVAAIMASEKLRNFVQAYEELLAELLDAQATNMETAKSR
jgi:hypothetical protein